MERIQFQVGRKNSTKQLYCDMDSNKGQHFIIKLKKALSNQQFQQISTAIEREDKCQVKALMYKYLKRREADQLYPQVLQEINLSARERESKHLGGSFWDEQRIKLYLKGKLDISEYDEILGLLQIKALDLCESMLEDYLRYNEAQEVMPHIRNLILQNIVSNNSFSSPSHEKEQILQYIKQKVDLTHFEEIVKLLKNGYVEDCTIYLRTLLRKKQAEYISPLLVKAFPEKQTEGNTPGEKRESFYPKRKMLQAFYDTKNTALNQRPLTATGENQKIILQIRSKIYEEQANKLQTIMKQIKEEFGEDSQKEYEEVQGLINSTKVSCAVKIIKEILGKKAGQRYEKILRMEIKQKTNKVLESAIYLKTVEGQKIYELQTQPMLDLPEKQICNVLIVGMTGVGKSTYLNSLVNELMGVEMTDQFRYVIIKDPYLAADQVSSCTQEVTIYGIPKQGKMKKAIRLIDAPGLGDTGGIRKDIENIRKIKEKIESSIPYLNLIIYVFKASQTRVTKESEYVMNQIMGIFGKDLTPNILFVLTFADFMEPNVIKCLKKSFPDIIKELQKKHTDWFIKVNNSAMFKKINIKDPIDSSFYSMGSLCLSQTIKRIFDAEFKTTEMTVSVLRKREEIQATLEAFNELIIRSLNKQSQIKSIAEQVTIRMGNMESVDYKVKYKKDIIQEEKTDRNVTSCTNCKFSCHKLCSRSNNADKEKCMMMIEGKCKVCPSHCSWRAHENAHVIYKRTQVEVVEDNEQLLKRYNIQKQTKEAHEELLMNLLSQYTEMAVNIDETCSKMKEENDQLELIQMRKVSTRTVIDYIDILIANEKAMMLEGFKERVAEYQLIQSQKRRMVQFLNEAEQSQLKDFKDMMESKIKALIPREDIGNKILEKVVEMYENFQNNVLNPEDIPKDESETNLPEND